MEINRALKQVAFALGVIGAAALLLTASGNSGTTLQRAVVGLVIIALVSLDLLALLLPPGMVRDVLLYVATAVQLLITLVVAGTFFLFGTVDAVTGFVAGLPGAAVIGSSLLLGIAAIALAALVVLGVGLGLSISRHDMTVLRDALALSIIGLELILPVVVAVGVFVLAQIFAGTQDPDTRAAALLIGAVAIAVVGVGLLASLAFAAYRAEKRDFLTTITAILMALIVLAAIDITGLIFYIGIVSAALGWLLILFVRARQMAFVWVAFLILLGASGLITFLISSAASSLGIIMLALALITVASAGSSSSFLSRGTAAGLAGISAAIIVIGGTINNGSGSGGTADPIAAKTALALFIVAGAFAAVSWVVAIIESARVGAWGWLVANVLLLSIGALLFGLFGPTAEDVRQSRRQRAQRREAGLA